LRMFFLASAAATMFAGMAHAGPQYLDDTKFAVSGYDVVAYQSLKQVPIGQTQSEAVPGNANITADYNGVTWAFSTKENRDKFVANPEAYIPAYDGHCAYGIAQGGKVPGNPNLWRIVDGKLYLNITPNVVTFWEENIPGQIKTAKRNWHSGMEARAASSRNWKDIKANDGTYSTPAPIGG